MAETQKKTVSVDKKEKSSLLDDEIGKDFFSWKSMSKAGDDSMDFSFDEIPKAKGKKDAFNFGKLDMDFDLEGDLDKLSSFKIDLPDLDFSSPSQDSPKCKEKSKEETSTGNHKGKKQHFEFSFDFNELDDFNFGSNFKGGEKSSKKSLDDKKVTSDTINSKGSKMDRKPEENSTTAKDPASEDLANSKVKMPEGSKVTMALEEDTGRVTTELTAPEDVPNLKVKMPDIGPGAQNSIGEACPPKSAPPLDFAKSHESGISPEEIVSPNVKHTDQPTTLPDSIVSSEPFDQGSLQNSPVSCLPENGSIGDTILDKLEDVCSLQNSPASSVPENSVIRANMSDKQGDVLSPGTTSDAISAEEQSVYDGMNPSVGLNLAKLQLENAAEELDKKQREKEASDDNLPTELTDTNRSEEGVYKKYTSAGSPSTKLLHDVSTDNVQTSTPKDSFDSGTKDKEAGVIRSRFFTKSKTSESQSHKPLSIVEKTFSLSSQRISSMQLCPAREKREDENATKAKAEKKLVSISQSTSRDITIGGPVLPDPEKVTGNTRKGATTADPFENAKKAIDSSRLQGKAVMKGEPVLIRSEKNSRFQANSSSLGEKTTTSSMQTCLSAKPPLLKVESVRSLKVASEGLKTAKRTPDLCNIKISRTAEVNKVSSNFILPAETNSLTSAEQNKELPGTTASKIANPIYVGTSGKQMPQIPSLKRKAFEESNVDLISLKPLKRPSESPSGIRNFRESSESIARKEGCDIGNRIGAVTKNIFNGHPTSGPKFPKEVIMTEMEIPSVKEDDGNVEKAKAYAKELENACDPGNHIGAVTKNVYMDHPASGPVAPKEVTMTEMEIPSVKEDDVDVEKAEAYAKELENICNMLKKKNDEAKELLVRAAVNNNNLLMLNHPIFDEKIRMLQKFAALWISKELPT